MTIIVCLAKAFILALSSDILREGLLLNDKFRRKLIRFVSGFAVGGGLCFLLFGASMAAAQSNLGQCDNKIYLHQDIVILGFPCPPNLIGSVETSQKGVEKIIEALDLLAHDSPRSFAVIERLKKAGPVIIIYDPNYPAPGTNITTSQIALFLPTFIEQFDKNAKGKQFTVIIGRDGMKWPVKELASVLVHELMGHGKQHLEERIDTMRVLDVECEAWLLEELAYQDFKLDKLSRDMVDFRQQLEKIHCSDFIRYMRKRLPDQASLWDVQNPDVMKLLKVFDGYIEAQRERGMISSAQAAALKQRDDRMKKAERKGDPQDLFEIGQFYMTPIGQDPDPKTAATWFKKAADKGHSGAQFALAQLYENGDGVGQDLDQAVKLYVKAAKQGDYEAFYALGVLFETGRGVQKNIKKAQALYAKARPGFDARPLFVFGQLHNEGVAFPKNSNKAYDFFIKAARLGDKAAQFAVGMALEKGSGVPKDIVLASVWIHKSAEQGYAPAKRKLALN